MQSNFISVISKLQDQTDASKFIAHSDSVMEAYSSEYAKRENLLNFSAGKIWTDKDYSEFARQNKKPMNLLWQKDSQRTFLGAIAQNKFGATFQPFDIQNKKAVGMAEKLKYRYMRDAEALEFSEKDKALINTFWATGVAYQELYVELAAGERPQYKLSNQNTLAIYWDYTSVDLGRRDDAQFVERRKYVSLEDLELNFEDVDFCDLQKLQDESYTEINKAADRGHETANVRNGLFMVIERFYKVTEREYYKLDEYDKKIPISKEEAQSHREANKNNKNTDVQKTYIGNSEKEYLYLAIACPARTEKTFLFNGKLRLQPRADRNSNKVLWPILECIAESTGQGKATGFAEHIADPVRIANGILTQAYHVARHSASTAKLFKPDNFKTQAAAKDFEKNAADPSKRFPIKQDVALSDVEKSIEVGNGMSKDALQMLDIVLNYIEKALSTPPALKGVSESADTAASLNQDRITQSFTQLHEALSNYRNFIRRRAELLRAYDVELNDSFINETVHITQKNKSSDPDYVTLNEVDEEFDEMGNPTGEIGLKNNAAEDDFKVVITDSVDSPIKSEAMLNVLNGFMQSPAIQQDAGALLAIAHELIQLTNDLPLESKERILQATTYSQQQKQQADALEQQKQQTEQEGMSLENDAQAAQLAQPVPVAPPEG